MSWRKHDQEALNALVTEIRAEQSGNSNRADNNDGHRHERVFIPADAAVIEKMCAEQEKGERWRDLLRGEYEHYEEYPSQSEATSALLLKLAFYTDRNAEQMKRIFEGSGLYRPKCAERRGGQTWLEREIERAVENIPEGYRWPTEGQRTQVRTPIEDGYGYGSGASGSVDIPCISFADMGEPEQRGYWVEDLVPERDPSMSHGDGGVAKTMLALDMALAIASDREEWLGFKVKTTNVGILDFELDQAEHNRRMKRLAAGAELSDIPRGVYYLSALGVRPTQAFRSALRWCKEHRIGLLIVDSLSIALEGDVEAAKDVLGFFRREINPFRAEGIAVHVIDHQSKLQAGQRYQDKKAFGSVFKNNVTRSVFQIEAINRADDALTVVLRHTKHNFGRLAKPVAVELSFAADKVEIDRAEMEAHELSQEGTLNAKDRVLLAASIGKAGPDTLVERSGLARQTVRNKLTTLRQDGYVKGTGENEGRAEVVELTDKGRAYLHTYLYKGTYPGTVAPEDREKEDEGGGGWEGEL